MTLLKTLQAHKGGLLHIKSQLFWYGDIGYDNFVGRVCLLLDATTSPASPTCLADAATTTAFTTMAVRSVAAHLLIDGASRWVWMDENDVEVISAG